MNNDEKLAYDYLHSLQLGEVVYEPDGKIPPDFLVGGRIAVEVRRLSQSYEREGERRALEQDTIPLRQGLHNLMAEFPPAGGRSWFVMITCRRPLATWDELRGPTRLIFRRFLAAPAAPASFPITATFSISFVQSQKTFDTAFVFGSFTDQNRGGWIVSEIVTNLAAYTEEKTKKAAAYRAKYAIWWLVFVDYIGTPSEESQVRQYISRPPEWDRIIVLNHDGKAYDI